MTDSETAPLNIMKLQTVTLIAQSFIWGLLGLLMYGNITEAHSTHCTLGLFPGAQESWEQL